MVTPLSRPDFKTDFGRRGILRGAFFLLVAVTSAATSLAEDAALDLFRQRIAPILQAKNPSSCSECHLSGVDLKQYIGKNQEETFASLRAAGLIDLRKPDSSKLLALIARKPDRPGVEMEKARREEYEAFRAWISAAAKDPKLTAAKTTDSKLGPSVSDEVIRHARKDRLLASFLDNVWSEVGRCAACHSPDRNQEQVKKNGERISWIKLGDPQATLDHLLQAGIVDLDSPEESLLLLKPTNQVKHGGGVKLVVGDRTYKQFRAFIEDYAASAQGKYKKAKDLLAERDEMSAVTDVWFKLEGVPAKYDGMLLQVDLYRWDEKKKAWSQERWGAGDRQVYGKGELWQQHLSVIAPRDSARAKEIAAQPALPPGRYLAKIFVDQAGKLQKDYRAALSPADLVSEIEVTSQWPAGYGNMTKARFSSK